MKREEAIGLAVGWLAVQRVEHGAFLSAEMSTYADEVWEIEFAHRGLNARSLTTDPSSKIVLVEAKTGVIRFFTVM